jgi:hypothetical protein
MRTCTVWLPGSSEFPMSCFHSVTEESTTDAFSFALSEDISFLASYVPTDNAGPIHNFFFSFQCIKNLKSPKKRCASRKQDVYRAHAQK